MYLHQRATINISIVNESTVISQVEAQAAATAMQDQITNHFFPVWGVNANIFLTPQGNTVPESYWQAVILDDTDQADALGYHELTASGQPLAKIFAKTDLQNEVSWTVTLSHEILEMMIDPDINLTMFDQTTNTAGVLYAYEVCDAVEDDQFSYVIDGIEVSDFVFPAWFVPGTTGVQFDYQNKVTAPLQLLSGGYIGFFKVTRGSGWEQNLAQRPHMHTHVHTARPRFTKRQMPRSAWKRSAK